jgi:hypothetical protein
MVASRSTSPYVKTQLPCHPFAVILFAQRLIKSLVVVKKCGWIIKGKIVMMVARRLL